MKSAYFSAHKGNCFFQNLQTISAICIIKKNALILQLIMEEQKRPNTIQHAMDKGLFMGMLFAANTIISSSESTFAYFIHIFLEALILVVAYRAAVDYMQTETDGKITVFQSFSYILNLFFFASLISALCSIIYFKYISPEYMTRLYEQSKPLLDKLLSDAGQSDNDIKSLFTAEQFAMSCIVRDCMIGMILGLIYAPLLKRRAAKKQ